MFIIFISNLYFNLNGLTHPVTIGLAVAMATLSSCKCGGNNSIKLSALFLIRSRDIDAAKWMRLFQILSKMAISIQSKCRQHQTSYQT